MQATSIRDSLFHLCVVNFFSEEALNTPFTAQASPNIAFIKYWGNRNDHLRIPWNDSISMNLDGIWTRTTVEFQESLPSDLLCINNQIASQEAANRVSEHLDRVRAMAGISLHASVESENNFPMGSGIASSASAFAALSLAASAAAGLSLSLTALSRLARLGSGSACRSIPDGYVQWHAGTQDLDSFAETLVQANYWDLVDCIVISSSIHKSVGSSAGHLLAGSSPLQALRLQDAPARVAECKEAILHRDFSLFSSIVEQDSNLMHSVMSTSKPSLKYWNQTSFQIIGTVLELRHKGIEACYTLDAGPNVHILTLAKNIEQVRNRVQEIPGVERLLVSTAGQGTRIIPEDNRS